MVSCKKLLELKIQLELIIVNHNENLKSTYLKTEVAIKEHFNTIHCSQGISLFGTLKLKFPQSQFRFSTNSFNSLIIRLIINIWKLWIFNIQEVDFYSSTFSYFTHYSWFFFQLLRPLTTLYRSKPTYQQIGHQLNTGITFGVYTGFSF